MPRDPMASAISAIENATNAPVTPDAVVAALKRGEGRPVHLATLFSDLDADTLFRLAISHDIADAELAAAYARAKASTTAINPDLEAALGLAPAR